MKFHKWLIVILIYVILLTVIRHSIYQPQPSDWDIGGLTAMILYLLLLLICWFATIYFLYKHRGRDALISAVLVIASGMVLFFMMLDGALYVKDL